MARTEFVASSDAAALRIAAVLGEDSNDVHSGYMLWAGARQVFGTDQGSGKGLIHLLPILREDRDTQQVILSLEELLLESHWRIAKSKRLSEATSQLRDDCSLRGKGSAQMARGNLRLTA